MTLQLEDIDKEDLPIKCSLSPCITKSFRTGITQLCGGNMIIETPLQISIDELEKFLVAEYRQVECEDIQAAEPVFYETQVTGSKGDKYLVRFDNNYWTCGCVGFGFRRKCKHIDIAKERYENV